MPSDEYIKPIKNGEIIAHMYTSIPLLLWIVYGFQLQYYFSHIKHTQWYKHSNLITFTVILIYCVPFLLVFRNIYITTKTASPLTKQHKSNLPSAQDQIQHSHAKGPPGFGYCMDTLVKEEDKKRGILAYWDYACSGSNSKNVASVTRDLLNRFYYINYAIFLVVILVYNTVTRINILKSPFMIMNIRFSLLLGTIGCLLPIIHTAATNAQNNVSSLIIVSIWMNMLIMNACSFIFIGLTILLGIV